MIERLSEGIAHIEDLPLDKFIGILQDLQNYTAVEKLDGAQLWVGIDEEQKMYASREGKRSNSDKFYSPEDWPKISVYNQFRAAHTALVAKQTEISRVLRPGDTVEAEVLFGRQPNSVTYGANGKSYIAFLRGVNETPSKIADQLSSALANQDVEVKVEVVSTADGKTLSAETISVPFQFVAPQQMDAKKLKQDAHVDKALQKLNSFLSAASPVSGYSNKELAEVSLTSVPIAQRPEVKKAREEVLQKIQQEYKLPIKNALLDKVSKKSKLTADDVTPEEDVGIEGIVLRDPYTGEQVKIVDKENFTAINSFNQSTRGEIQSSLSTIDPDADLASQGGLMGQLRIKIATAFGNRELAKPANMRKLMGTMKGTSPEETLKKFTDALQVKDFQGVKKKILAMASETYKELDAKLAEFTANKDNYSMELKNGKQIKMSDETFKKTLLTFAEARRNLVTLFNKLKATQDLTAMTAILYGGSAKAVHAQVSESLLLEKRKERSGEMSTNEFNHKDMFHLVNSYFVTVLMSMIIYHTDDVIGMRFLRDRKHMGLKSHSNIMSPLNHWGYAIWRANKPDLAKHVMKSAAHDLTAVTKKIQSPWWKFLHMDFSCDKQVDVNWKDHKKTLARLIDLSGLRTERLNTTLDLVIRFDTLNKEEKLKALKLVSSLAHRFVPRAKLFTRIRTIESQIKDEKTMTENKLLKQIAIIAEDGEGGDGGFEVGQAQNGAMSGTVAANISSLPVKLGASNHKTEMRRRNPEIKKMLYKFRDPRKSANETN